MSVICLLLLGLQSDPAVSLDVRARPLSEALTALSKATQAEYACAPDHANEIMVLRFKDRTVSEVRKKLAWALDAQWTQTETGWRLARPAEREKQIEAEAREARRKEVEAVFAKIREQLKLTPTPSSRVEAALRNPVDGDLDGPKRSSPIGYWTYQIWMAFGAATVSATPTEGYVTYSDAPNPAQKALPAAAIGHLKNLHEELSMLVQQAPPQSAYRNYAKKPLKTLVRLFRLGSSYGIWLTTYGPAGEALYSVTNTSNSFGTSTYTKPDELGKRAPAEYFPLPPLLSEYERVREKKAEYAGNMEPIQKVVISQELIAALVNPEKIDPLSYWNSEAILRWADDKSVCVCVPDRLDFASRYCLQPGKFHLGKLKQIAEGSGGFRTVAEPNWFLGRPTSGPVSEKTRFNRAALGTFLRSALGKKGETLDDYAKFVWTAGRQSIFFGFWTTVRKTLWKTGITPMDWADTHPYETWALIGSMGKDIPGLQRGQIILAGQATAKQKSLMTAMVYATPFLEPEPDSKLVELQREPTEFMDQGLPPQASFAVTGVQDIAIKRIVKDPQHDLFERASSATELGKSMAHNPTLDLTNYGTIQMGPRDRLLIRFKPHRELFSDEAMMINFGPLSKPFSSAELPNEFIQAVQSAWRTERAKLNG